MLRIVGEWENAVREAVELGEVPADTYRSIEASIATNKFNYQLDQQIHHVSKVIVPECGRVAELAEEFENTALAAKDYLKDALALVMMQEGEEAEGVSDTYQWLRIRYADRKNRALQELLSLGQELKAEINEAMRKLIEKGAT